LQVLDICVEERGAMEYATKSEHGAKIWYVADGWMPLRHETRNAGLEGHEAIMILNCQDMDAEIMMDIYFEDRDPIENVRLKVAARRVKCIRMDHPDEIGGVQIPRLTQYALRFRSNIGIIVQYGRMDVTQPNLAFIGMMGMPG
jgi:hypothetical protein